MRASPKVSPEELLAAMQGESEPFVRGVAQAVQDAPDGQRIAGSEEMVRDLGVDLRRQIFERAVQMRIDAAEAASPSAGCDDREATCEQGAGRIGCGILCRSGRR